MEKTKNKKQSQWAEVFRMLKDHFYYQYQHCFWHLYPAVMTYIKDIESMVMI